MAQNTNTISLSTAQAWAEKWRKVEGTYNAHHELKAFLIPKADLIRLLEEEVDAVRAYIGVDSHEVEKLMLVGTRLNEESGVYEDMLPDSTPSGNIYDFTEPCPPQCDPESSLNNLD
ncbi:hypothetical protein [Mesonia sp. K7]|uniref:hypothetical protein n=1 Tax=Mesonia sp. K7 TaxID=2218606 RepID=UPI000DAA52B8|nr:hypothetical protein [Mesonia sp. K7]PZD77134.1 hypothetical protein DNG35_09830 [Mesonia sp. K7]